MRTTLIDRAVRAGTGYRYQIRRHGDVYQVIIAPCRANSTPAYTTRELAAARAWIAQRVSA